MIRRRVVVHGRVHGVGFRLSCRERAVSLGVAGWVRNCADGTVEAVFEGDADAVDALVAWCSHGPRGARVVGGVESFDENVEQLDGFAIR